MAGIISGWMLPVLQQGHEAAPTKARPGGSAVCEQGEAPGPHLKATMIPLPKPDTRRVG